MNYQKNKIAMNLAIVIPVYKSDLDVYEELSLFRVLDIFDKTFKIILVAPETLKGAIYSKISTRVSFEFFDDSFFRSISAYNQLMLSALFYERFIEYEHILIYQLDGFILNSQLIYSFIFDFDYIGAPWLEGIHIFEYNFPGKYKIKKLFPAFNKEYVLYVGNGGVSIRNVKKSIMILKKYKDLRNRWEKNEDAFFSLIGLLYPNDFHVAPLNIAALFSFETNPRKCWEITNETVPFAVHAWQKYDLPFMKFLFQKAGVPLSWLNDEKERAL